MRLLMLLVICATIKFATLEKTTTILPPVDPPVEIKHQTRQRLEQQSDDCAIPGPSSSGSHDNNLNEGSSRGDRRETSESQKSFHCKICGKVWKSASDLKVHSRVHTNEKPYACKFCGKAFSQKNDLKQHTISNTEGKRYPCELCSRVFRRKCHIEEHMRTHWDEMSFSCILCGKAFRRKSTLESHMKTHAGDEPYTCNLCSKTFFQKYSLKQHALSHTDDKPYSCPFCGKSYSQKSALNVHIRSHPDEKPHSCEICSKASSQTTDLRQHMMKHTAQKPYSCSLCNMAFTQKSSLNRHMRMHMDASCERLRNDMVWTLQVEQPDEEQMSSEAAHITRELEVCIPKLENTEYYDARGMPPCSSGTQHDASREGIRSNIVETQDKEQPDEEYTSLEGSRITRELVVCIPKLKNTEYYGGRGMPPSTPGTQYDASRKGTRSNTVGTLEEKHHNREKTSPEKARITRKLVVCIPKLENTEYCGGRRIPSCASRTQHDASQEGVRCSIVETKKVEQTDEEHTSPKVPHTSRKLVVCIPKLENTEYYDARGKPPGTLRAKYDASREGIRSNIVEIQDEKQPDEKHTSPEGARITRKLIVCIPKLKNNEYCDGRRMPPCTSRTQNDASSEGIRSNIVEIQEVKQPKREQLSSKMTYVTYDLVACIPKIEYTECCGSREIPSLTSSTQSDASCEEIKDNPVGYQEMKQPKEKPMNPKPILELVGCLPKEEVIEFCEGLEISSGTSGTQGERAHGAESDSMLRAVLSPTGADECNLEDEIKKKLDFMKKEKSDEHARKKK